MAAEMASRLTPENTVFILGPLFFEALYGCAPPLIGEQTHVFLVEEFRLLFAYGAACSAATTILCLE
jgi:hypothetical protein